jgi:hypothetical protein
MRGWKVEADNFKLTREYFFENGPGPVENFFTIALIPFGWNFAWLQDLSWSSFNIIRLASVGTIKIFKAVNLFKKAYLNFEFISFGIADHFSAKARPMHKGLIVQKLWYQSSCGLGSDNGTQRPTRHKGQVVAASFTDDTLCSK